MIAWNKYTKEKVYLQKLSRYQPLILYTIMLKTNRSLLKYILFSIITLGIYAIVMLCKISNEVNQVASPRDGKHTMFFLFILLLTPLTLGICALVWYHRISNRIGDELKAREINCQFSASDYWLWNILGSLIVIGPFVYIYKLLDATNQLNKSYNEGK